MNNFISFGCPDEFEIAARWTIDPEPRSRHPCETGWSTGDLRITVAGQVLTENKFNGKKRKFLSWYLAPLVDWLISNWTWLLHEEAFSWPDRSGQPAAVATLLAMERTIASSDEADISAYSSIHSWWLRHALRAADSSALYPDVYFRRVDDDIEISWNPYQPVYAPDGFSLTLAPGYVMLPVKAVAEPLWKFIEWGLQSQVPDLPDDRNMLARLQTRVEKLAQTPLPQMELLYLQDKVRNLLFSAKMQTAWQSDAMPNKRAPAIEFLDSAVLMFGGHNVEITENDVYHLMALLRSRKGGIESASLANLVSNPSTSALTPPHIEGYALADELREELGISADMLHIDIDEVLKNLSIEVIEAELETHSIRGVAVAGDNFSPAILINKTSVYNVNEAGKRFTLAHELCHILYDRTRAKRISHVSGPWASAYTEKRANAFAAMFLASTTALRKNFVFTNEHEVATVAEQAGMGVSALVEHLFNLNLIDDVEREVLRPRWH